MQYNTINKLIIVLNSLLFRIIVSFVGMFSTVFRRSMNKRWQRIRSLVASISKLNDLCLPRGNEGQGISMTVIARPPLGVKPCHDVPQTSKKRIDAL